MTVVVLSRDLLLASRILSQADAAGIAARRAAQPMDLPPAREVGLLLVNWAERDTDWGQQVTDWCREAPQSALPRIILFGPHTDLEAHAAAKAAGLGPMWARSKLVAELPQLVGAAGEPMPGRRPHHTPLISP